MANIATMAVNLVAKTLGFEKGMDRAKKKVKRFRHDIKKSKTDLGNFGAALDGVGIGIGRFTGPTAIGAAAAGAAMFTDRTLKSVDALGKQAQSLQISVSALDTFRFAGGRAGVSAEKVDQAIRTMTQRIGEAKIGVGEALPFFNKLGIDLSRFNELSVAKQFEMIGKSLGGITDNNEKLAAFGKIFGEEAGSQMMRFFADGNFEKAAKDLKQLGGAITDEDAKRAARYADAMGDLTKSLGKLGQESSLAVAPELSKLAKQLSEGVGVTAGLAAESRKINTPSFMRPIVNPVGEFLDKLNDAEDALRGVGMGRDARRTQADILAQRHADLFDRMHRNDEDEVQRDRSARTNTTPIVVKGMSN